MPERSAGDATGASLVGIGDQHAELARVLGDVMEPDTAGDPAVRLATATRRAATSSASSDAVVRAVPSRQSPLSAVR